MHKFSEIMYHTYFIYIVYKNFSTMLDKSLRKNTQKRRLFKKALFILFLWHGGSQLRSSGTFIELHKLSSCGMQA